MRVAQASSKNRDSAIRSIGGSVPGPSRRRQVVAIAALKRGSGAPAKPIGIDNRYSRYQFECGSGHLALAQGPGVAPSPNDQSYNGELRCVSRPQSAQRAGLIMPAKSSNRTSAQVSLRATPRQGLSVWWRSRKLHPFRSASDAAGH